MATATVRRILAPAPFAVAALMVALASPSHANSTVAAGYDLFTTRDGTSYDFGGFAGLGLLELEGRPLEHFDFGDGPVLLPETDTIVRRLADAQLPIPQNTIPIEIVALQLQSVDPIDIGNGPEFILIDLDAGISGQMTIQGLGIEGVPHGFFDSSLDFTFNVSGTISGFLGTIFESLSQAGTPWHHFPVPGEPIIDGINHRLNGVDPLNDFWLLPNSPVQELHPGFGVHIAGPKQSPGAVGPCAPNPNLAPVGGAGFFPDVKTQPLQASDLVQVPWCAHHGVGIPNLAGYRFSLLYDQSEIDLLHTGGLPPFGAITPGGVSQTGSPGLTSVVLPLPTSSSPVSPAQGRTQTVWLPPAIATGSGVTALTSSTFPFATFAIHARHTSLTNSDFDFVVGNLSPILHAFTTLPGTFSVWSASFQTWFPASIVFPSSYYIEANSSAVFADAAYLGLEHMGPQLPTLGAGALAVLTGTLMLGALRVLRRPRQS